MDDYQDPRAARQERGGIVRALQSIPWLTRDSLSSLFGTTFWGKRDQYEALGYVRTLTPAHYRARYERGGIAARIVEAMPSATWRGTWEVIEDDDPKKDTEFEKTFADFDKRVGVKRAFERADILAGLGRYAVILIGAPGPLDTPITSLTLDSIKYLMPYAEDDAPITQYVTQQDDERFGFPLTYGLRRRWQQHATSGSVPPPSIQRSVHYTRMLHVADGLLDDPLFGTPRLRAVWNLLDCLDKVIGGGAEAFWKRADGGTQFEIDKDMPPLDPDPVKAEAKKQALEDKFDDFTHSLKKNLVTRGIKVNRLGSEVADLRGPASAIMDQISATTGMPQRILMGSELGRLASNQDKTNWDDRIQDRRESFAEYQVLRPFVDMLIRYGALPQPAQYRAQWPSTDEMDQTQRVAAAVQISTINKNEGTPIVTPSEIRTVYLGLEVMTPEQQAEVDQIKADKVAAMPAALQPGQPGETGQPALPGQPPRRELPAAGRAALRVAEGR